MALGIACLLVVSVLSVVFYLYFLYSAVSPMGFVVGLCNYVCIIFMIIGYGGVGGISRFVSVCVMSGTMMHVSVLHCLPDSAGYCSNYFLSGYCTLRTHTLYVILLTIDKFSLL